MSLDKTVTYVSGPYQMASTHSLQRTGGTAVVWCSVFRSDVSGDSAPPLKLDR